MHEIQAPAPINDIVGHCVFLAGSIEMGAAEEWQAATSRKLRNAGVWVLNPRRNDWDSSWEQKIENDQFREQVEWELQAMERADEIIVYFSPGTKSPITLLELGLHADSEKLRVVCPEGFWRKGNVDIVCKRYGVNQYATIDEAIAAVVG